MKRATCRLPAEILLVEDNLGDARLLAEAFQDAGSNVRLTSACDGIEASEILGGNNFERPNGLPDLILLDLHLPRKDGRSLLRELKESERHRGIPVIVLSASASGTDLRDAYALHANCFIHKPPDLDGLMDVVRAIDQFWLKAARLPSR